MKLTIQPNTTSEWYALVKETQCQLGVYFDDHVDNYIILTLDEFMSKGDLMATPLAVDFLKSLTRANSDSNQKLRNVGDRCLILSGLFPEHAEKINVSISYFNDIGQQAYLTLADRSNIKLDPSLFFRLGSKFIDIRDVLYAMRRFSQFRIIN